MNITTAVLTNSKHSSFNILNENTKVVDLSEKLLVEQTEKINKEFRKIQERINNIELLNSINDNSKYEKEIEIKYHGPRNYIGLESIIEFCDGSLVPITKLEKLYLDELYLYIECANANNILGIKKTRNVNYSKEAIKKINAEKAKETEKTKFINKNLNEEIDMLTLDDIKKIDNEIYYYSKKQMAPGFRILISEIVELIKYSNMDKLIIEDKENKHYLIIDDNFEEAFFCLKKIAYIMNKAIEFNQSEVKYDRKKAKEKTLKKDLKLSTKSRQ